MDFFNGILVGFFCFSCFVYPDERSTPNYWIAPIRISIEVTEIRKRLYQWDWYAGCLLSQQVMLAMEFD